MATTSSTMAFIQSIDQELLITCSGPYDKPAPHPVHQISARAAVARFGGDVTLDDLEARFSCSRCGAPIRAQVVPPHARRPDGAPRS